MNLITDVPLSRNIPVTSLQHTDPGMTYRYEESRAVSWSGSEYTGLSLMPLPDYMVEFAGIKSHHEKPFLVFSREWFSLCSGRGTYYHPHDTPSRKIRVWFNCLPTEFTPVCASPLLGEAIHRRGWQKTNTNDALMYLYSMANQCLKSINPFSLGNYQMLENGVCQSCNRGVAPYAICWCGAPVCQSCRRYSELYGIYTCNMCGEIYCDICGARKSKDQDIKTCSGCGVALCGCNWHWRYGVECRSCFAKSYYGPTEEELEDSEIPF